MRLPIGIKVSIRLTVVAAVLVGLLVSAPLERASASPDATTARLRIGVAADGLVRITPSELATPLSGSGVDPAAVDPRTFALSSQGQPVAIRVVDANTNDIFDDGDFIEFFGQRFRSTLPNLLDRQMEEKYTDEQVYWLDIGGSQCDARECRVAEVDATPNPDDGLTPPTSFPTTVRAEVNLYWTPLWSLGYDTRDTWYWDRIQLPTGGATDVTRTYAYTTPYPAAGFPGAVRLEVVPANPGNAGGPYPSHLVTVSLADTELASASWGGGVRKVLVDDDVPSALLGGQTTSFQVRVIAQAPDFKESMYINYWELDYRRLFRAYDDRLDFRAESAGLQEFEVTDFASTPVAVWDITDPTQPKRLTGVAMSGASNPYAARFRASPAAGDRFWMQGEGSFAAPASITRPDTTWLRSPSVPANSGPGADTVILTPASLRDAAETLATWHRAHGRRTLVVDIQDVYDEFNDGIRHPKAVRQMLAWAAGNWTAPAPAYLVLMGDGHYKLKDFVSPGSPVTNPIPPYLIFKDPWQGEIPADGLYGDYNGDDLPDVAVGRIPVNTLDEAAPVLYKITQYDESIRLQPWQQQAVFSADRRPDSAGDFWALSDEIINNYTPADLTSQRIYLGTDTYPNADTGRTALANAINSGAFMVQWTGHGAPQIWSKEEMWRVKDVSSLLTNGAGCGANCAWPVVMTFNCLDGWFTSRVSTNQSLAEAMLLHAGGGSVAAISPAGDGLTPDQTAFRKILMDTMFKDGVRELGRALLVAEQKYAQAIGGMNYLVYEMNLFGDPALRLPASGYVPRAPVVTAARSGNTANLSWSAVILTMRNTSTAVTTYGIWRSTEPYFDPDSPSCNCTKIGETADLSWPITSFGDVAHNYFYVVRAQNSAGWSPVSNRMGDFDFALTPGGQ